MVDHLMDRLSSDGEGKKKVFRDTLMEPITEFLRTLPSRNITDSAELKALGEKAEMLIQGINPKLLRTNEELRETVLTGFTDIKSKLDTMIETAPKRIIRFED